MFLLQTIIQDGKNLILLAKIHKKIAKSKISPRHACKFTRVYVGLFMHRSLQSFVGIVL